MKSVYSVIELASITGLGQVNVRKLLSQARVTYAGDSPIKMLSTKENWESLLMAIRVRMQTCPKHYYPKYCEAYNATHAYYLSIAEEVYSLNE